MNRASTGSFKFTTKHTIAVGGYRYILEIVEATKSVPARHPARDISNGVFLPGVLSAKWAIIGAETRDTKP
jgi:hypothetical protein